MHEIRFVEGEFLRDHKDPPVNVNLPPLAGAIWWAKGLSERLSSIVACFETVCRRATLALESRLGERPSVES